MRQSGKCIKCGSTAVTPHAMVMFYNDGSGDRDVLLRVDAKPAAKFLKQAVRRALEAYVCSECGYTEFYADDPKELYYAFLDVQKRPKKSK